jgi:hypothetical protein
MKRRDFLKSTPASAIGLGAVAQLLSTWTRFPYNSV